MIGLGCLVAGGASCSVTVDARGAGGAGNCGGAAKVGCPAQPTCSDVSACGQPCLDACSAQCVRHYQRYSYWVSPYEVAGTVGWGRHQGIAIFGIDLALDTRFQLSKHPELTRNTWPTGSLFGGKLPADVETTMAPAEKYSDYAMCAPPALPVESFISNHGRTLSTSAMNAGARTELAHLELSTSALTGTVSASDTNAATADQLRTCVAAIPDGYCDTVCGNCSYVLPRVILATSRGGDWSQPEGIDYGTGMCPGDESYYGGPNQLSQRSDIPPFSMFRNPYTHCAQLGCSKEDEAPSLNSYIVFGKPVVSGIYGHNSNTDAEASFLAFQRCIGADMSTSEICDACGATHGARQTPCLDQTNNASHYWSRTAEATVGPSFRDLYPIISEGMGGTDTQPASGPPRCSWAPFDVNGM